MTVNDVGTQHWPTMKARAAAVVAFTLGITLAGGVINTARADDINASLGTATAPISLAQGQMSQPTVFDRESPASTMVAQAFREVIGPTNPNLIGIQNPHNTKAGLAQGEVTTEEAAAVLPAALTVVTTQLTGAQLISVLEQQWQTDSAGNTPNGAPYLRLGLSSNVDYTYDETRPAGRRITAVFVNGIQVTATSRYTIATTNDLAAGGDNFRAFTAATSTTPTGRTAQATLESWITSKGTVSPRFALSGVQVANVTAGAIKANDGAYFDIGWQPAGSVAPDTLDSTGSQAPKNSSFVVQLQQNGQTVDLSSEYIANGRSRRGAFAYITTLGGFVSGAAVIRLTSTTGTVVRIPVTLAMSSTRTFVWGDQTGDGSGDMFIVDKQGDLWLYSGLNAHLKVGHGWGAFTWISHTPDVTGDGIDDLLARRSDGNLYLYPSRGGDGKLGTPRQVGRGWNGLRSLTIMGDLNGDRLPELVGIDPTQQLVRYTLSASGVSAKTVIGKNWGQISFIVGAGSFNTNHDTTNDLFALRSDGIPMIYLTTSTGALKPGTQLFDVYSEPVRITGAVASWQVGRSASLDIPVGKSTVMALLLDSGLVSATSGYPDRFGGYYIADDEIPGLPVDTSNFRLFG